MIDRIEKERDRRQREKSLTQVSGGMAGTPYCSGTGIISDIPVQGPSPFPASNQHSPKSLPRNLVYGIHTY